MKFSIITVSFNSEKTIERTIKSVLSQSYEDYEYIIVDGASSDSTTDIIKKYEPLFKGRMKWKSEPDKGIYDAMNKGILKSTGDIIWIVNSDDWLEPNALQVILDCYREKDPTENSICCGWMYFHYKNGKFQILKTKEKSLHKIDSKRIAGCVRHPATLIPKKIYTKYGLYGIGKQDSMIEADTELLYKFHCQGVKFIFVNKVITNMSDGGISNSFNINIRKQYAELLKNRHIDGYRFFYLYYSYCVKKYIKSIIPIDLIILYRKLS